MKIGDKVSFLSEIGGGKIAGFKGKNIALVEDEDGFQIPMPVTELVVVSESSEYKNAKYSRGKGNEKSAEQGNSRMSVKAKMNAWEDDEPDDVDLADKEITYVAPVVERKGGNVLNLYLAFVPTDMKNFSHSQFELYLVNDSNYYVHYICMNALENLHTLEFEGELEPNTKYLVNTFGYEQLNDFDTIDLQMIAFKRDKEFVKKPVVDASIKVDKVNFYKLHAFKDNDFFDQPAIIRTIIENDASVDSLDIAPEDIRDKMLQPNGKKKDPGYVLTPDNLKNASATMRNAARGNKGKDDVLVVDLHADELLETTLGMSSVDILNYQLDVFRKTLAEQSRNKGQKIVFIHGKGEGVLRHAILNELRYRYKKYRFQDASFQEYGYGATQVTIV